VTLRAAFIDLLISPQEHNIHLTYFTFDHSPQAAKMSPPDYFLVSRADGTLFGANTVSKAGYTSEYDPKLNTLAESFAISAAPGGGGDDYTIKDKGSNRYLVYIDGSVPKFTGQSASDSTAAWAVDVIDTIGGLYISPLQFPPS
jgi:hypothetical protein